jgi:hypothetical protein
MELLKLEPRSKQYTQSKDSHILQPGPCTLVKPNFSNVLSSQEVHHIPLLQADLDGSTWNGDETG